MPFNPAIVFHLVTTAEFLPKCIMFVQIFSVYSFSSAKRLVECCKFSLKCNFTFSTNFQSLVSNKKLNTSCVVVLNTMPYLVEFSSSLSSMEN